MSIMAWIEEQRRLKIINTPKYNPEASHTGRGLWTRCDNCGVILYIKHLKENQRVCFGCGFHLYMDSQERIQHLLDEESWRPLDQTLSPCDPLGFVDQKPYTERLLEAQERTGLQDAIQTGTGVLDGIPIALGIMDFQFMGGSMGSAVGEKITRLIEYATQEGLPLLLVCASGGARMQEGIFSLMQMAKISAALHVYQSCAKLVYISILTSPTTGGVTASFAMLGDLIFAEPKALIGFAGRRVIEQTLQEELPDDFQTAEYMIQHGLLDLIVPRCYLRQALSESMTLYKDAPFRLVGNIPYGVSHPLSPTAEEKTRRRMSEWNASFEAVNSKPGVLPDPAASLEEGNQPFPQPVALYEEEKEGEEPLSQESYRDILLSLPPTVGLFLQESEDEWFYQSYQTNSHQPLEVEGEEATSSEAVSQVDSTPLEKTLALAQDEVVEWKACYTNQKSKIQSKSASNREQTWKGGEKIDKGERDFTYRLQKSERFFGEQGMLE